MNDSVSKKPQHFGRHARANETNVASPDAPHRASGASDQTPPTARRATPETQDTYFTRLRRGLIGRGWFVLLAATVLILMGLGLSLLHQGSNDTTNIVMPDSTSDPANPPSQASPLISPSVLSESLFPATSSPLADPSPFDGTTPTAAVDAVDIQLNDARFTALMDWVLDGDELIENNRRVVRLSHQDSDARLQAVTLEPSEQGLAAACSSLVDFQQAQFTEVENQLATSIGVDGALGSAVRCGFDGTRTNDGVQNAVTFTIVERNVDSHVLVLRTTVPMTSLDAQTVVGQLNAMACGASTSFGVSLPLC